LALAEDEVGAFLAATVSAMRALAVLMIMGL